MSGLNFNFDLSGIDNLLDGLTALGSGGVETAVQEGLYKAAEKMRQIAQDEVPNNSGELRQSITVEKITSGYDVGTNKEYAMCVEYGTGYLGDPSVEHTTKKMWFVPVENIDERSAVKYGFPKVEIKGKAYYICAPQKPHPFIYPALKIVETKIPDYISAEIKQAIERALGI